MRKLASLVFCSFIVLTCVRATEIGVDLSAYSAQCGIAIEKTRTTLTATWKTGDTITRLALDLTANGKLIDSISIAPTDTANFAAVLQHAEIEFPITVGSRMPPKNQMYPYVFFDKPFGRKHETFNAKLEKKSVNVASTGKRAEIRIGSLSAGPFSGELVVELCAGSPLIHVSAALTPTGANLAYIYDALLASGTKSVVFEDLSGALQERPLSGEKLTPLAVRYRTLMGVTGTGTVALFPPPHAFFFPRDRTDNLSFVQFDARRFGLRQAPDGGGAFVPWIDAPNGKTQRMDFFMLASAAPPKDVLAAVKRYTHNDTFLPVDGYQTFTSHYHSRLTMGELGGKSPVREFAYVFKRMGVKIVHLSEFHGDGNPDDSGEKRLPQMRKMFELCNTYSDNDITLIPGEEGNKYLAEPWPAVPPIHPGHWIYLLPKPVYFTFVRAAGQPFAEDIAPYGNVFHVGGRDDMVRLINDEHGLAWTTHPRIKASFATPDAFKDQDFYKSAMWLGGAWKAMPANLSDDRLGRRCFDLLDDMSNWAVAENYPLKALPGEVDVFEIDRNHELYGHMNINYVKLAALPPSGDASSLIEVLRKREFFTTTGEILIRSFELHGNDATAELEWTFPLAAADLITGDGKTATRQHVELTSTGEFGRQTFTWKLTAKDAKWVRLEVTDVARDTAYTQAMMIEK